MYETGDTASLKTTIMHFLSVLPEQILQNFKANLQNYKAKYMFFMVKIKDQKTAKHIQLKLAIVM